MGILRKIIDACNASTDAFLLRDDMDRHCEHQPVGVCDRHECQLQDAADRSW